MKRLAILLAILILLLACAGCQKRSPYADAPDPVCTITMSDGATMRFYLHLQDAPNTVAAFTQLANGGFYDGLQFFKVVPGVLIQSGCPKNDGTGNAGFTIRGEFSQNGVHNTLSHLRGTLSMARLSGDSNYDTASSQFFIMQGSYPEYDGEYAAFGTAMDAATLDTLDKIASRAVDAGYVPLERQYISTIRVNTHGIELTAVTAPIEEKEPRETPEAEQEEDEQNEAQE